MTDWISLDWDYVTSDCRKNNLANRCIKNCSDCGDTGKIGRGNRFEGYSDWKQRLNLVQVYITKTVISDVFVYDNHGEIYQYLHPGDMVLNYDYHTDDYEDETNKAIDVECWNWVNRAIELGVTIYNYCDIKSLKNIDKDKKYNLFVAWSTPCTRSDLDGHLFRFLMNLNTKVVLNNG